MKPDDRKHAPPPVETGEALAIAYDPLTPELPKVTAKGSGPLAGELVRLALEHGIPIRHDPDLVRILAPLDIGQSIPEEAFVAVAELLAFIYGVHRFFEDLGGMPDPEPTDS